MPYQPLSTVFAGTDWSPTGLLNSAFKQGTGQTSMMGANAINPASKVTPPKNTLSPSQAVPSFAKPATSYGNQNMNTPSKPSKGLMTPPVGTPAVTSPAPVAPTNTSNGLYGQTTSNLATTTPSTGVTGAINTTGDIATGAGQNPSQIANQNNIQQGAQTSANISQNQTPAVLAAEQKYNSVANNSYMTGALTNSAMAESVSAGAGQQFASNYANQLSNANQNVQNALTGQGQQITAANQQGNIGLAGQSNQTAAAQTQGNLANTAQANQIGAQSTVAGLPYGLPSTAGANGGGLDPQTYSSNLAQQVINGTMSYQDAQKSMGYAGSAGSAFLQQAISKASPGFNFNQANTNSQTQGVLNTQGAVASGELDNLQSAYKNMTPALGFLPQNTSIPVINSFDRWIGALSGNASTQNLNDASSAARSAVATALGTAYNTTPTDFTGQVNAWFPKGASAQQVQQGIDQFNALMAVRQKSYTSPGTSQYNPAGSSDSGSTSQNISGTNFTKVNGKWVAQ